MTQSPLTPLAADFDTPDEAAWRHLAEAGLKGLPWDRLVGRTPDDLAIKPLYRETDAASARDSAGLPGQAPFTRGPAPVRDRWLPWDIRQSIGLPDPAAANADALADLERGVSSLELLIGGAGRPGLPVSEIKAALKGVHLDLAPVALNAGLEALDAAHALAAAYAEAAPDPSSARPIFNLDPLTAWALSGGLEAPFEETLATAAQFAVEARQRWPRALAMRANGRAAHEAGATPALELAVMLASGVAHLRALDAVGVAPGDAAGMIQATLSVGPDVIPEMAKLRAARLLWSRLLEACGVAPESRVLVLQAITSRRMMTRDDAWTNILRATAATFAASAAGADSITTLPLTTGLGYASPLARRIARNTQIILMEESHLGRVADPGGGAWALEAITQDLARAAWAKFQTIEAKGGIAVAMRDETLQADIAAAHQRAMHDVARRKTSITGVSDFPLLGERTPAFVPTEQIAPLPDTLVDAITPWRWSRLSEPFEALRKRAKEAGEPKAFLATLGPLAEFSARANFAKNLLAAGGVDAIGADDVHSDDAARVAGLSASGARVAVLCGADTRYQSDGEAAARALKAAGVTWLIYAGKPADEARWRDAGVDQFIFAGQDAVAALTTVQSALGLTP